MTFASATTAGGSEIAQDLLLGHMSSVALNGDLVRQTKEDLSPHVVGKLGTFPGEEEPSRPTLARDRDDVLGPKHLARSIAKASDGYDAHVITSVVTHHPLAT